jgi:hypothetical protein
MHMASSLKKNENEKATSVGVAAAAGSWVLSVHGTWPCFFKVTGHAGTGTGTGEKTPPVLYIYIYIYIYILSKLHYACMQIPLSTGQVRYQAPRGVAVFWLSRARARGYM